MPAKLVSDKEKYVFEYDGSIFYYRRASSKNISDLRRKHTNSRGILNDDRFGEELIQTYILGWDNVLGTNGKPIDFNKEDLFSLPSPILISLINRINGEENDDAEFSGQAGLEKK